ncbi:MAG: thiamine ABC transporter substrate-binding protein [Spirochaetaceae bacterium]|nr:thiamine ABC transporter substrate-binding protein [Spirochaetaceae bacterium]
MIKPIPGYVEGVSMYRQRGFFITVIVLSLLLTSCSSGEKTGSNTVTVWTYDSFDSEWGPGPEVKKRFEDETGLTLNFVVHGDAGELLSRLLLEGDRADADVILGLDQNMLNRALSSGFFEPYTPEGFDRVFRELRVDSTNSLIPMDYSYFAFVYDSELLENPPRSLEELTEERFAKKIILLDPRTSSPGQGFFAWTREVYGRDWPEYWRRLAPSILTIAGGWTSGYGLFTSREAPLVLSYTTSPGYHLEYENTERYRAAIFSDGHPLQVELAGLLRGAANKENGKRFMDFMLSPAFQETLALKNSMYPAIDIALPGSFRINPKSDKPLLPDEVSSEELDAWARLMPELLTP